MSRPEPPSAAASSAAPSVAAPAAVPIAVPSAVPSAVPQAGTGTGTGTGATSHVSEPGATVFVLIGGEPVVRALVDEFYDEMARNPAYTELRALHPQDLSGSRDKLFWFLCGWTGGPDYFAQRFGHPRLRARHLPFAIGTRERDQWLACMQSALQRHVTDATLQARLYAALTGTADWMRNQDG